MRITLTSKLVSAKVNEGSAFSLTASFFDDGSDVWTPVTPTTAKYRIDRVGSDATCSDEVLTWTTLTPATSISIPITATNNAVSWTYSAVEPRQVTVKVNDGLSTQSEEAYRYSLINLAGSP